MLFSNCKPCSIAVRMETMDLANATIVVHVMLGRSTGNANQSAYGMISPSLPVAIRPLGNDYERDGRAKKRPQELDIKQRNIGYL